MRQILCTLIERAGGLASTGRERILEIRNYHQRTPVIMGAAVEVERIIGYYEKFDSGELEFDSPLFKSVHFSWTVSNVKKHR